MKKFYLLLCGLALAATTQARELSFSIGKENPEAIAPNSTIKYDKVEVEDFGIVIATMAPELYISSDIYTSSVELVTKCISGQTIQVCAGGNCSSGQTVTKKVTITKDERVPLLFEYIGEFEPGQEIPEVVTEFTAVDTKYPETEVMFTLVMNSKAGLTVIENNKTVRAVEGGIEYNLDGGEAQLALYDLNGTCVLSSRISGNGSLSSKSLRPGVYVYSLNGSAHNASGKLYIR